MIIEAAAHELKYNKAVLHSNPKLILEQSFYAGFEFAQRWISIEEELPDTECQDVVLVKTDNESYATAYYHGEKSGFIIYGDDAYCDFGSITHWRPIIFKY